MKPNMVHYNTMTMKPNYKSPFSKFVKKAHKPLQLAIEDAVEDVCENPEIGEGKVGDLAGIWVYKFNSTAKSTWWPTARHHWRRAVRV